MARRKGFVAAHDGALSIAGPLTRDAKDLALLTKIGAQYSLSRTQKPLKQCRLLAITEYPGAPVDASVAEPTEAAINALIARKRNSRTGTLRRQTICSSFSLTTSA